MAQIQDIVDLVLQALAANAKSIDDLTEALNVGEGDYIELNGGRKMAVSKLAELIGDSMAEVTHAELKALRDGGALVPGKQYRITDYTCTTVQEDTQSAGHQFDIIVTADDASTLNEDARACLHDGDEYFAGCKLEAWKLKYTIDNDPERFAWADEGGIESMQSIAVRDGLTTQKLKRCPEFDNLNPQSDFEEYKYAWGTDADVDDGDSWGFIYSKTEAPVFGDLVCSGPEEGLQEVPYPGKGVIYRMVDEWENECPYDFKNIMFKRKLTNGEYNPDGVDTWVYTFNCWDRDGEYCYDATATPHDISEQTRQDAEEDGDSAEDGDICYNNKINAYYQVDNYGYKHRKRILNNIVFLGIYFDDGYLEGWSSLLAHSNTFGNDCRANTFGNNCKINTFGNNCENNAFGNGCDSNTFGNNCHSITFGNTCSSNIFGFKCDSNTFGNDCGTNTFGDGCSSNTFGDGCSSNTFGDNCSSNIFGDNCSSNIFGKGCYFNTFGNNCENNAFGNGCDSNTFGNVCNQNKFRTSCYQNTIGNYCNNNTFGNNCENNTFGNSLILQNYTRYVNLMDGVKCTFITCSQTTSGSNYCQNVIVNCGIAGASATNRKTLTVATANNAFITTFGSANDTKINV